mmetsp:Transcript_16843/g.67957  ORF Transcript_16843/g.67957 Transcript_16843/m.67957 type:complete len:311 (+) Transcript_16843:627-1559(+)
MIRDPTSVVPHLEVDVAVEAPRVRPRVADDPVRHVGVLVVADELDGVVELHVAVGARGARHDAARVRRPLRRVARDRHGAVREEVLLERVLVLVLAHDALARRRRPRVPVDVGAVDEVGHLGRVALGGVAVVRSRVVRVRLLRRQAARLLDVISPGYIVPPSPTSRIRRIARGHLLHGERGERHAGERHLRLDRLDRRVRPARAAVALVLDGRDDVRVAPVERGRRGVREARDGDLGGVEARERPRRLDAADHGRELVLGPVGELGDAVHLVEARLGQVRVARHDLLEVVDEHQEPRLALLIGPVFEIRE